MTVEERLIEIEIKLTRQEDLTQELNQLVYQQQKQIDELKAFCASLARQAEDLADSGAAPSANERPPHY
ncbi:SlyX family protein [Candidimonas humi]|uniref:SlyX family protein n=1 Tax=Candidimonas humi TaxID=683355 RepID=A0ABV8P406_9BURK|nr:SlyX family protein [Candidimonas humi]MBV6306912.1 SlyX family protein [Candidimonas humi]